MNRNFVAVMNEPPIKGGKSGFAVEFQFHEAVEGIGGDTVLIYLRDEATQSEAQELIRTLNQLGARFAVSPSIA